MKSAALGLGSKNVCCVRSGDVAVGKLCDLGAWQVVLDVRYFDVFARVVVAADFEDERTVVRRNGLLGNLAHNLTQPAIFSSRHLLNRDSFHLMTWYSYGMASLSSLFAGGMKNE